MNWFTKLFSNKPLTESTSSESENLRLLTGDTTIVANVMARADGENIRQILEGFEILQTTPGMSSDHLRIASIVSETYPLIQNAPKIEPMSTEWIEMLTAILATINENAEKYVEVNRQLGEFLDQVESRPNQDDELIASGIGQRHYNSNELEWSDDPGAYETHLIRRSNSPYFPQSRRIVSNKDLMDARQRDYEDCILANQRFAEVLNEFEPDSITTSGDLLNMRERLDDVILFSMGVGGAAKEIATNADNLRDAVISKLREAFSDNEEALENVERADAFHHEITRKHYIPVSAQMQRDNSPIPTEETLSTILSEDPNSIATFISSLPEDGRALIRLEAIKLMREVLNEGYIDPLFEEKLAALEGEWDFMQEKR